MQSSSKLATCCACFMIPLIILISLALFGLGIAEIVMGAKYLNDCPKEKMIPIYLIVMGVLSLFTSGSGGNSARSQRSKEQGGGDEEGGCAKCCRVLSGLISLFLFAWFIAGQVWVFNNYKSYTKEEYVNGTAIDTYCHPSLMQFAFWSIIAKYIVLGFFFTIMVCMCCGACCFACCAKSSRDFS